jgi:hypothetical protein
MGYDWDQGSLWLTFSYSAGEVKLESKQVVPAVAAPSDDTSGFAGQSGFWCELRDKGGQTLYRLVTDSPLARSVEVPAADAQKMERVAVDNASGSFRMLVPNLSAAATLALVSSPLDPAHAGDAAVDIFTLDLTGEGNIA